MAVNHKAASVDVLLVMISALLIVLFLYFIKRSILHKRSLALRNALLRTGQQSLAALNPLEFEKYCSYLLEDRLWLVQLTKTSGDMGADIIATKDGVRLVIQCKRHQENVGVRAIQEAYTALQHYQGTKAAVVCVKGYTRQAKQLAASTNVHLWTPDDLLNQ
jgi:restriction system protein